MTTFLTIGTPDKHAIDTTPTLQQLLFPRQTDSTDSQSSTNSQSSTESQSSTDSQTSTDSPTSTTTDSSSSSSGTATTTSTDSPTSTTTGSSSSSSGTATITSNTHPVLITVSDQRYFWTSMPALDVSGTPVTTIMQGDPLRPIAIWNSTQASGYETSNRVGQWSALGILIAFALLFLILFLSESIGFLRRKRHPSPSDDFEDESLLDQKTAAHGHSESDSAIPLTDRSPVPTTTTAGDRQSRRLSTYTPLPLANLPEPEPYDAPGFEGGEARGSRYYNSDRPAVGGRAGSWEDGNEGLR